MQIPCHLCIQVDCSSCVSVLQWEGQISCSELLEGLILLALLQDIPNCSSSPLPQGEGHIFHICPSFLAVFPSFVSKLWALMLLRVLGGFPGGLWPPHPHPPTLSCPGYSEFCILPFGWFLLLLCSYFSFLHLFPLGCTLLWLWKQWMMGCHLLKTCTFPWVASPAMTQWGDRCPGSGGGGCTVDRGGRGENCS